MKPTFRTAALALAFLSLAGCERAVTEQTTVRVPHPAAPVSAKPSPAPESPAIQPAAERMVSRDAITDSVITTRIKAGILSDPGMAGSDVSVNTDRGVVSLTGSIKSHEQAAIASAHAQRQDGVMRVDNQLAANLH